MIKIENPFDSSSADGYGATAIGTGGQASGSASVTIGGNTVSTIGGVGIGGGNEVSGSADYGIAIGSVCMSTGLYSIAMGIGSQATGTSGFAAGTHCLASGYAGIAFGYAAVASAQGSIAFGFNDNDDALTSASFAASGDSSIAFGLCSAGAVHQASGINSVVIGKDLSNTANYAAAFGREYSVTTSDSFNLGWGAIQMQVTQSKINVASLPTGTLAVPPAGLVAGDIWIDQTGGVNTLRIA